MNVSTLPIIARLLANHTGATKMVENQTRALEIVNKMAKERYKPVGEVLAEFLKYQKNGECTHFWPDENTACQMLLEKRLEK